MEDEEIRALDRCVSYSRGGTIKLECDSMSIDKLNPRNKPSAEGLEPVVTRENGLPNKLDEFITSYKGRDLEEMVGTMNSINSQVTDIDSIIQGINGNNMLVGIAEEKIQQNPQAINGLSYEERVPFREAIESMARRAASTTDKNGFRLRLYHCIELFDVALKMQLQSKESSGESFEEKYPKLAKEIYELSSPFLHSYYVPSQIGLARLEEYTDARFREKVLELQKIEKDLHAHGFIGKVREYVPAHGLPISQGLDYAVPSSFRKKERKDFENYFNALEPEQKKLLVDFLVANYRIESVVEDVMTFMKEGVRSEKDIAMKVVLEASDRNDIVFKMGLDFPAKSYFKGLDMNVASAALEKGLELSYLIGALDTVFSGVDRVNLANYILKFARVNTISILGYEKGDETDLFLASLPSTLEHELRERLTETYDRVMKAQFAQIVKMVLE